MQRNWIGRSEGARASTFAIRAGIRDRDRPDPNPESRSDIEVFTTRIDTIYGATFILLAPEHPLVQAWSELPGASVSPEMQRFRGQDRTGRMTGAIEKEGFDTGRTAVNPFTGKPVPVWVANFVLGEYGTGAVMGVPAHDQRDFEFAQKYSLRITTVVKPRRQRPRRGWSYSRRGAMTGGARPMTGRACWSIPASSAVSPSTRPSPRCRRPPRRAASASGRCSID